MLITWSWLLIIKGGLLGQFGKQLLDGVKIWWAVALPAAETAYSDTWFCSNQFQKNEYNQTLCHLHAKSSVSEFQNCNKQNKTKKHFFGTAVYCNAAPWDAVTIILGALTWIWWDYVINFPIACHGNNNIIKCMVIIAAGSSLISRQKGWSPFSCRIIAKPLTWTWINKPAGSPPTHRTPTSPFIVNEHRRWNTH